MRLLQEIKRVWIEVILEYPVNVTKVKYFHSGTAMNILVAMFKPLLPEPLRSNVETGCCCETHLDRLYLVPTVEAANQRILNRMVNTLERRYLNELTFQL
jgi:hypothetical protein